MKISRITIISILIIICLFTFLICGCNENNEIPEDTKVIYETTDTTTHTENITIEESAEETIVETIIEETEESTEDYTVPETTEPVVEEESESQLINLGKYKLTAYCPCEKCNGKWAGGITATGVMAKSGHTIAVDPSVIPYGTKIVIWGHTYVAEDCGGAIKGNRIDIYFDTHEEALEFGVRYAEVYKVVD